MVLALAVYTSMHILETVMASAAERFQELTELEHAVKRMKTMIADACDRVDRPIDEAAMRYCVAARLAADPIEIDPAILDFRIDADEVDAV